MFHARSGTNIATEAPIQAMDLMLMFSDSVLPNWSKRLNVRLFETLTLTQKEQYPRLQVLNSLLAEHMRTLDQAATFMGVSAPATPGASWRPIGGRAQPHSLMVTVDYGRPTQRSGAKLRSVSVATCSNPLPRCQPHSPERAARRRDREGIEIGRTTLRRIPDSGAGLKSPRRRRQRPGTVSAGSGCPREGMLVQVDGSHHRWLGDDGPPFALLLGPSKSRHRHRGTTATPCSASREQENTRDYFLP